MSHRSRHPWRCRVNIELIIAGVVASTLESSSLESSRQNLRHHPWSHWSRKHVGRTRWVALTSHCWGRSCSCGHSAPSASGRYTSVDRTPRTVSHDTHRTPSPSTTLSPSPRMVVISNHTMLLMLLYCCWIVVVVIVLVVLLLLLSLWCCCCCCPCGVVLCCLCGEYCTSLFDVVYIQSVNMIFLVSL